MMRLAHRRMKAAALGCAAALAVLARPTADPARAQGGVSAPGHTLTRLADGRLLVLGGEGADGPGRTAALVDPTTGFTHPLPAGLQQARAWHTATLLPTGRVLVVGGFGPDGTVVAHAELFDPHTGRFSMLTAGGGHPRALHSATLLIDGHVLVAGGVGHDGEALDLLEMWDTERVAPIDMPLRLSGSRYGHTATLLGRGAVALWGGLGADGTPLAVGDLVLLDGGLVTPIESPPEILDAVTLPARVEDARPADGSDAVPLDTRVALRFSRPVDPESVAADTVRVRSGTSRVATRLVVAEGGRLVFLTPTRLLRRGATYEVRIDGVRDPEGTAVAPHVVRFRTSPSTALRGLGTPSGSDASGIEGEATPKDGEAGGPEAWEPGRSQRGWHSGRPPSRWETLPPLRAAAGVTAVAGRVLRLNGEPLDGVTLAIDDAATRTDATGRFLLRVPTPGAAELLIDGGSASTPGRTYGVFETWVNVQAGTTTVLPDTIWMPKLDTAHAVTLPVPTGDAEVVVTTPKIPGLEVRIPPGTVLRDHRGDLVTALSITPIPLDRPPFALPEHVEVPIYFTVQPGGAYVVNWTGAGARLVYPNYTGKPPGTRFDFWHFDPGGRGGWYRYGHGAVTPDGRQVMPEPGTAIYEFTGAMVTGGTGPATGPPAGSCSKAGDPVDLATGLLVMEHTDFVLPDVLPLALTRTYRQGDTTLRAFGRGIGHPYDLFMEDKLQATPDRYKNADLVLPDGGRVKLTRTNCSTTPCDFINAIFEHHAPTAGCPTCVASPTRFFGATFIEYQPAPQHWELTLKDGTVYTFLLEHPLGSIRDRHGNTITIGRDVFKQITRVTSPHGRWIEFTRGGDTDCPTCISQATDNAGRVARYCYDSNARLVKVADAALGVTTYAYDDTEPSNAERKSRLLKMWDPKQNATCAVTSICEPVGTLPPQCGTPTLQVEYWQGGLTNGMVKRETLADGVSTYDFTYTITTPPLSAATQVTDPRGVTQRVTNDANGYCVQDTRAYLDATQRTVTYTRESGTNRITASTEPLPQSRERKTTFTYDAANPLTSNLLERTVQTGPAGGPFTTVRRHTFTYDPRFNQLATITDALTNRTVTLEYANPFARLSAVIDPTNRRFPITLDAAGRIAALADPLGNTTTFTYQGPDLVAVTDPTLQTTRRGVDAAGHVRSLTDPLGHRTFYDYDNLDRLVRLTDPLAGVVEFAYDKNGNLETLTDNRHAPPALTRSTYDARNFLQTRRDPLSTDPANHVETFAYDGVGNLTTHTDRRGVKTDYRYDARERPLCAGFGRIGGTSTDCLVPGNYESTIGYTFDVDNRLTQAVDSLTGTTGRTFDDLARLTSESGPLGTVTYTNEAASGRRLTLTVAGQPLVGYCYDDADRLTKLVNGTSCSTAPVLVNVNYDGAGRRSDVTLPNGAKETYGYDAASRISSIQYTKADASVLGGLTYTYDAQGNRTMVGGSWARTGLPTAIASATYDAADRTLTWGGVAQTHDLNGNLTSAGTTTYMWSKRNLLAAISVGSQTAFAYDAFGRRTTRTVNGVTTQFLYDGLNPVQEQLVSDGGVANILGGLELDQFFARTTVAGPFSVRRSLTTDALGSTLALLDDAGVAQTEYRYEPYGATTYWAGQSDTNAFQFTGRENDGATNVYYYRARYYAPTWGRFISEDPMELEGGDFNLYGYVGGNPPNFVDPLGLRMRVFPGYWAYLRTVAPNVFCRLLRSSFVHAQDENADCEAMGEPPAWDIDPDTMEWLKWCLRWGYIKWIWPRR